MKKKYMIPTTDVVLVELERMIASSVSTDDAMEFDTDVEVGAPGEDADSRILQMFDIPGLEFMKF